MAEPETVAPDETQEITDEMKEKLLLNLFGNAMNNMKATPPTKETGQGDSVAEDAVEAEEKQKGDQSENLRGESATAESPNREGSGPAVEAVQTPDGFSSSEKKDESGMKALLELEDKLKSEEETLTPGELEERHKKSQQLKADANNFYKDGFYLDATAKYSEALTICPLAETKSRSVLHANLAAALMGELKNKEALPHLDRALELDPDYFKALERRARLNKILEHLDDALKDYEKLLELKPKHCEYMGNVQELQERIRIRNEEMKKKMIDSLKQLGNVFLKPFGLSTDQFNLVPNENGGYSVHMGGK